MVIQGTSGRGTTVAPLQAAEDVVKHRASASLEIRPRQIVRLLTIHPGRAQAAARILEWSGEGRPVAVELLAASLQRRHVVRVDQAAGPG